MNCGSRFASLQPRLASLEGERAREEESRIAAVVQGPGATRGIELRHPARPRVLRHRPRAQISHTGAQDARAPARSRTGAPISTANPRVPSTCWNPSSLSKLAKQDHPPVPHKGPGAQLVKVDPARHGRSPLIAAIPAQRIGPGGHVMIDDGPNESASRIEHS